MYICVMKLIVRDGGFFERCAVCRSCVCALQKVGKAGIVLKPEQLQAVRRVYKGRDVSLWLPTGFVNPSAMKFSFTLRPSHQAAMCEGPGHEATIMFSLIPITKPLCGRGLGTSRGQGTCTMIFTERKTEYVAHAQTVCTRPSPRFVGGAWVRGYRTYCYELYTCTVRTLAPPPTNYYTTAMGVA